MAELNQEQRRKFNAQIAELKANGFFPTIKRKTDNDNPLSSKFLIISYGGTGAGALYALKKTLKENIEGSLEDSVRLLAIDSDRNEQFTSIPVTKEDGTQGIRRETKFTNEEFFHLSGSDARNLINSREDLVRKWMDSTVIEAVKTDPSLLAGDGASGTRQLSRLMLMPATSISGIQTRITSLIRSLVGDTAHKLTVMFISGISGGTGSGVVVDLTYIIRDVIERFVANSSFYGFLLLPGTGTSDTQDDINKGNENGYAALKEVNYFMTIAQRGELYKFRNAGGTQIQSGKNIFDVCYLVDGGQSDVTIGHKARQTAFSVLSAFLLDMVTLQSATDTEGGGPQPVEAILTDARAIKLATIRGRTAAEAPRDADYIYAVMGHSETVIPINLIKSYVANKIFNRMYESFQKCGDVNMRAVETFYKTVLIPTSSREAQRQKIDQEAEKVFKDPFRGPFYVINLMKGVSEHASFEAGKFHLDKNKARQKAYISEYCSEVNQSTFAVFTAVMDSMKEILNATGDMLLDSKMYNGNRNYSFMPINLSLSDTNALAVRKYLDKLVNDETVYKMAEDILEELIDNRDSWAARISGSQADGAEENASQELRRFWNHKMNKLVSATLQDYLIKYYSGDENARFIESDPSTHKYLDVAADVICREMVGAGGRAHPMAQITTTGSLNLQNSFDGTYSMLIPAQAPALKNAVEQKIRTLPNANCIKVYNSAASDRVSCYSQHVTIPAFKFKWVCTAEPIYEGAVATNKEGLHLSTSIYGRQWKNFPNLLPQSTWSQVSTDGTPYVDQREAGINKMAHELFYEALKLGLAYGKSDSGNFIYTVKLLPDEMRPEESLYKELEQLKKGTTTYKNKQAEIDNKADEVAKELFSRFDSMPDEPIDVLETKLAEDERVHFDNKKLFINDMIAAYGAVATDVPSDWSEEFASLVLRKLPETMISLRGTLDVIRRVTDMVNRTKLQANKLVDFAKILSMKALSYNEELFAWEFDNRGMVDNLAELEPFSEFDKMAEFYIMFEAFKNNEGAYNVLMEQYADEMDKQKHADRAEVIKMTKQRKDNAAEFKAVIDERCARPDNSKPMSTLGTAAFKNAAERRGYDPRALYDFYRKLSAQLELV